MLFRQFFETTSSTYTYLLADPVTREAMIIDPVRETMDRDLQFIAELNLTLKVILETHIHADHVTSSGRIRQKTGALIYVGEGTQLSTADRLLKDGEAFQVGQLQIRTLATPGHTNGCTSYFLGDRVFTGDTLLIRGCGRTDFQQGSSSLLFESVREKLFMLPSETLVFPGHDYKGRTCSSLAEEMQYNPRLNLKISKQEFIEIMASLNLQPPQQIDVAVPANLKSGL